MAARGWASSTVTAIGAAAGVGAAALGLGYGLGIVVWQPVLDAAGEALWLSSLAWVAWIAATATVLGAVYASRVGVRARAIRTQRVTAAGPGPPGRTVELAWRTTIAVAAAIGAAITIPLVMLPARAAHRADTFQPQVTAGAYAIIGIIAGLLVAVVAVNVRVIAANLVASAAWVWGLAAVSVIDAVRSNRTVGTAQLAAWQFTERGWFRETLYMPGALLMLAGALLVGVFAALPADRREESRVAIAISGALGPLLVAAAYFLAVPKLTVRTEQLSAYLFAPYAVLAGVAGSVLVAALGPMRPRRATPVSSSRRGTLTEWTRNLGTETESKADAKGEETMLRLGADGTDSRADELAGDSFASPRVYPTDESVPATTGTDPAAPTATGRAAVTQPLWPEKPKPRKRL